MKKLSIAAFSLLFLVSCVTLFPEVTTMSGDTSSLIVLETDPVKGVSTSRGMLKERSRVNMVNTGFYPVVTDSDGNEVSFRLFEGSTRGGTYYYLENVKPGKYTVTGFRYLYMTHYDFIHVPIKDLKFDGQRKEAWQKTDFYPLPKPVTVQVRPGKMESLGRYVFYFETVAEKEPLADLRWKITTLNFESVEPDNKNSLQDMKNWRGGEWVNWNTKNDETAKP